MQPMNSVLNDWKAVLNDPSLENLPFKIETDESGKIIMSPVSKRHTFLQYLISKTLEQHLEGGYALQEAAVQTTRGVRVTDVAWVTKTHFDAEPEELFTVAPEICVEVWSPSNTTEEFITKRNLYFAAGALEVWICDSTGQVRFYDASGELEGSKIASGFPAQISAR
jgi:Uma2 family endonuclease